MDTTLVVAVGEFGRTPKISQPKAGRDHCPDCYTAILAGGGIRGGALYGSSDKVAAYPATSPVSPADLAATIFWRFGINPHAEIHDSAGRPYRVAEGEPVWGCSANATLLLLIPLRRAVLLGSIACDRRLPNNCLLRQFGGF